MTAAYFDSIHPAADLFPLMADDELRTLGEDIKKHGLREPMLVWADADAHMYLLDGRNRLEAMKRAGIEPEAVDFKLDQGDPFDVVISYNVKRRHLTTSQKRDTIAAVLKARPERSDRATAAAVGVDHKTVSAARTELEGRGEIPHVDTKVDTRGRAQPARKPKTLTPEAARKLAETDADRLRQSTQQPSVAAAAPSVFKELVEGDMQTMSNFLVQVVEHVHEGRENGYLTSDVLREFVRHLRESADAIEGVDAKPVATHPYAEGDVVEFQEAPAKRWHRATVAKVDGNSVEIVDTRTGNHRTPHPDRIRAMRTSTKLARAADFESSARLFIEQHGTEAFHGVYFRLVREKDRTAVAMKVG